MEDFNKAPFNFVPLNHEVYIPEWGEQISQDIPFEDGEDGIIRFVITNTTPLYIKNGMQDNADDSLSAHIDDANGVRHYYIPATSIKGMLRSVLEVLSFSKLQQYDADFFGYRNFDTKLPDGRDYIKKMQNVQCGWLKKTIDNNGKEVYFLQDCGEVEKIAIKDLPSYYVKVKNQNAIEKAKSFNKQGLSYYPTMPGEKNLVCTGDMHNKKHEYLFPAPNKGEMIEIDKEVVSAFISVYKPSPYYDFIKEQLSKGEYLPVFFVKNGSTKVKAIGLTRMLRYPYTSNVSDGVQQTGKNVNGENADGRDMTECIFGYARKEKSLRGRVQVGNAFAQKPIDNFVTIKGILGQPNASYYPYYLKQRGSKYQTYNSASIEIAGRKRYRVHSTNNISELPQGNGNEKVKTTLYLIPIGNHFVCEIKIHNIRPVELGAILSALTFHGNGDCHHNIGMAKSMGYGRLQISDITLDGLLHDADFYMKEFEKQMSLFLKKAANVRWSDTEQVTTLMQIAADHTNRLGYMDFEGYKRGKRDNEFSLLTEPYITTHSMLTNLEYRKLPYLDKYTIIEECIKIEDFDKAESLCGDLETLISPEHDPLIDEYRQKIKDIIAKREYDAKQKADDEAKAIKEARLIAGLLAFLDEKYPLKDEYKVKDFKVAISKVAKWMKDKGETSLDEEELTDLRLSLSRIYASTTKPKDKKDWQSIESKWWKELSKLIGSDETKQLFNDIIG